MLERSRPDLLQLAGAIKGPFTPLEPAWVAVNTGCLPPVWCFPQTGFAQPIARCVGVLDVRLHCCPLNCGLVRIHVAKILVHERLSTSFGEVGEHWTKVLYRLMDVLYGRAEDLGLVVEHSCGSIWCLWLEASVTVLYKLDRPYHGIIALIEWYGAALAYRIKYALHVSKKRLHRHTGYGIVEHCVRCRSWLQEQGQDDYKK